MSTGRIALEWAFWQHSDWVPIWDGPPFIVKVNQNESKWSTYLNHFVKRLIEKFQKQ